MVIPLSSVAVLVDGLDHPEGVARGSDGFVYAGGEAGQVYRVSLLGEASQFASTGGFSLGMCLDAHHNVYVCDQARRAVVRVSPSGQVSAYSTGDERRRLRVPNYPVFDGDGNLYVSDSGGWKGSDGTIQLLRPDGSAEVATATDLAFPNGLALDPEGRYLYAVLSNESRVVRFARREQARLGPAEHFVTLPRTVPDGLAFDAQGGLLISCYAPDAIYRFSSPGRLELLIEDWERTTLASPTNIAFAGADMTTLVIASLGRWHLATCQVDVPGMPLNYPAVQAGGASL
ncbi:MAG: SMP-30/gluconolactonase/LRE family protein [Trueperaceae bacterium]